jgi:hypothetical protein
MNLQRIGLLVGVLFGCVAVFSTWATLPVLGKTNGLQSGAGMSAFICLIVIGVLVLLVGNLKENLPKNPQIAITILSLFIVASGLFYYMNFQSLVEESATLLDIGVIHLELGWLQTTISGAALFCFGIAFKATSN